MRNKTYTLVACAFASVLAFGSMFGCAGKQGSSEAVFSQALATQQITNDGQAQTDAGHKKTSTDFSNLTSFEAKTTDGKSFTQDDLAKADVTLVNFWAFGCSACEDEMPHLAQLSKTLPANVQVITVCTDEYATAEEVSEAMGEAGFEGTALVSGSGDIATIVDEVVYVPTTIAFNSKGEVVGAPIIGKPGDVALKFTQLINEGHKQAGKDTINVES